MKAVLLKEKSSVSVDNVRRPRPGSGDVLVKMRACGLCGSDLEKISGAYGMSSIRLGHEPAGEISYVGEEVDGFSPGDRVFVHHHVACYSCSYCLHGDYTMCGMYQKSNIDPCGLSEEFLVPRWNVSRGGLIRLPNSVTFEEASLIEPLACCVRGIRKCEIQKGDDIAILGAGPAGLMHVSLAKIFGAGHIIVLDRNQFRLDFAKKYAKVETLNVSTVKQSTKKLREITDQRGVDIAILATGSDRALAQSIEITKRGGRILLFGVPPTGSELQLDVCHLYRNEISLIPSYGASEIETNQAVKLLRHKRIEVRSLITHRFNINNAAEAIERASKATNAMKVIVTCD